MRGGAGDEIPTGVVTLLFTDIEGSTKLLQRTGERYPEILAGHHRVLRQAIAAHRGHEVDTAGDGFFVAFSGAADALRCALGAQRALAADPLLSEEAVRVRMGLHTGEVQVVEGDYLGLTVHHAARVGAAGHGGQVLVSETTRVLAGDTDEWSYIPLGAHELKDLVRPVELFQLAHPSLHEEFPPIRSLSRGEANLPRPRTTLVGRDGDIAALAEIVGSPGLVTLTGPGGCGKTRLAIATAAAVQDHAPGGVFFVDLRPAQTDAHVAEAVAAAVGVGDPTGGGHPRVAIDRVAARLGGQRAVLLLDNCEHVVAAAADVVDGLLAVCPELTVLATSRDLLGLEDEVARRVSSLAVPDGRTPLDDPHAFAALDLFEERARRVAPRFSLENNAEAVARICRRLDGMPLAIELAAGRLRHMSVDALEQQLSDMFRVLVGSDRRAMQRHQTLEAVVGWSFDLLAAQERHVLDQLSGFLGAFAIQDAERVCSTTLDLAATIYRLVDRSLVDAVENDRYRLLETIRAFAQRELHESGKAVAVRDRHLAHVVAAVARMGEDCRADRFFEGIDELEPLADDVRAALAWAVESQQFDLASRLVADAPIFWHVTGRWSDTELAREHVDRGDGDRLLAARAAGGFAWGRCFAGDGETEELVGLALQRFSNVPGGTDDLWYGQALVTAALHAGLQGEPSVAVERADTAEAWWAGRGGAPMAFVLAARAGASVRADDLASCRKLLPDALNFARASGNGLAIGACLFWSGLASVQARNYSAARSFYSEGLHYYRRPRHKIWLQWELDHLAMVSFELDDLDAARAYAEEGLAVSRASGLTGIGNYYSLLDTLSSVEVYSGRLEQAALYLRKAAELSRSSEPHSWVPLVAALGSLELDLGNREEAVRHTREAFDAVVTLEPIRAGHGSMVRPPLWNVLSAVGYLVGQSGDPKTGLVLRGAAERISEKDGLMGGDPNHTVGPASLMANQRMKIATNRTEALRRLLDREVADSAWAKGMSLEDPVTLARDALDTISPDGSRSSVPTC